MPAPHAVPMAQRLEQSVRVDDDGCWVWTKWLDPNGYGMIAPGDGARRVFAHRAAYTIWIGEVPQGLELDHLCRNRACVNPLHLEPVTHKENILRGLAPSALNAAKTHCSRGHEFNDANTYWRPNGGGRDCRPCDAIRSADRYAKRHGRAA